MGDNIERTYIMVKPGGIQRGLTGEIIKRFEQKGFKMVAMKFMQPNEEIMSKHHADLSSQSYFTDVVKYMSSGPVVCKVWEGLSMIKAGRQILGETYPAKSIPSTIRGDLCVYIGRNMCHSSDSVESAEEEIALWFRPEELVEWKLRETVDL